MARRPLLVHPITVGLAAVAVLAAVAPAAAYGIVAPYGFSTPTGSFALPYWQNLFSTDPVTPDTLVFGDLLYIEFLNALGNRTVVLSTEQTATGLPDLWSNATYSVPATNISVLTFTLPASTGLRNVKLCVDGGCMTFAHQTPITLLPSGILSVGGLDILAFGLTAEFGLLAFPSLVAARALTRKALWTPKFKAWLFAPHVALGFVLLLGFDYPAFDSLFGGLGFVLIPVVFDLLLFLWALHLFNVAIPVETLRAEPNAGRELTFYRWRYFIGERPDGALVLIGCYWRDWVQRLVAPSKTPVLYDPAKAADRTDGPPVLATLTTLRTETRDERSDAYAKVLRRRMRGLKTDARAWTRFKVTSVGGSRLNPRERDPPRLLSFVDTDKWLNATMPRLTVHRTVRVPEVRDPTTGAVVKPAETVRKLAWPHYTTPSGAETSLAGGHYLHVPSVMSLLWVAVERAWRRIAVVRAQNFALRTTPFVLADESTEISASEIFSLLERERFPMTDEEAEQDLKTDAKKGAPPAPEGDEPSVLDREPSGRRKRGGSGTP